MGQQRTNQKNSTPRSHLQLRGWRCRRSSRSEVGTLLPFVLGCTGLQCFSRCDSYLRRRWVLQPSPSRTDWTHRTWRLGGCVGLDDERRRVVDGFFRCGAGYMIMGMWHLGGCMGLDDERRHFVDGFFRCGAGYMVMGTWHLGGCMGLDDERRHFVDGFFRCSAGYMISLHFRSAWRQSLRAAHAS